MSSVRDWYGRFRQLIQEGSRFLVVGGIGFVVTDGGTNLLQVPLHGWLKANVIATLAGMVVTYLGSRYWSFRHRQRGGLGRETILFVVLNGVGLGIQLACIGFTNYALGQTDRLASNIALFLGIVLGTLFRFWSYRKWVWMEPATGPALDPAEFVAEELSPAQPGTDATRGAPRPGGHRHEHKHPKVAARFRARTGVTRPPEDGR